MLGEKLAIAALIRVEEEVLREKTEEVCLRFCLYCIVAFLTVRLFVRPLTKWMFSRILWRLWLCGADGIPQEAMGKSIRIDDPLGAASLVVTPYLVKRVCPIPG